MIASMVISDRVVCSRSRHVLVVAVPNESMKSTRGFPGALMPCSPWINRLLGTDCNNLHNRSIVMLNLYILCLVRRVAIFLGDLVVSRCVGVCNRGASIGALWSDNVCMCVFSGVVVMHPSRPSDLLIMVL